MTIVIAIGMMVVDPNVLVNPYVFAVINVDVDVIVATLDIGPIAGIFN